MIVSMGMSSNNSDRLLKLLSASTDGILADEQQEELVALVSKSPEARKIYVSYMFFHAMMQRMAKEADEPNRLPTSLDRDSSAQKSAWNQDMTSTRTPVIDFQCGVFQTAVNFLYRPLVLTLFLTIGLPCILLVVLMVHICSQPAPVDHVAMDGRRHTMPLVVARLTDVRDDVWEKSQPELSTGSEVTAGQLLNLRKGLVSLTFTNGARVILEGPTTFRTVDAGHGFLHEGALVAQVPKNVQGFSIETPLAKIVDLGTEFGVSVNKKGIVEAHIFEGMIKVGVKSASGEAAPMVELFHAGEAARIEQRKSGRDVEVKRTDAVSDQFVRRLPPATNDGLPEPKIVFAHHGDRDPKTEGWELIELVDKKTVEEGTKSIGPMNDGGTPVWFIKDGSLRYGLSYHITAAEGLTPEIAAKARTQGWVLRARIKALNKKELSSGKACLCSFWGTDRDWTLRPITHPDGRQSLCLFGKTSLGLNPTIKIPNSRDRYIDYEMRYHPKTNDVDVYIDGKLVVTGYYLPRVSKSSLQFGVFTGTMCDMRIAGVEWGILEP